MGRRRGDWDSEVLVSKRLVEKSIPEPNSGCLIWLGDVTDGGYGFMHYRGKLMPITRVVWERRYGPIPYGFQMCHKCDNPSCINIDHLFPGTYEDNIDDAVRKGRRKRTTQKATPKIKDHLSVTGALNWLQARLASK